MKKWLALPGVLLLLSLLLSCASSPAPENPEDSLVIGYFVLDYPDGYFDKPKRTFSSGITIYLTNQSTGRSFWVSTSGGYYQFLSNGTDTYSLDRYKHVVEGSTTSGTFNRRFTAKPHSVVYLGHSTLTYARPRQSVKTDVKVIYWEFDTSHSGAFKDDEVLSYLKEKDPESPWLEYQIVHPE
jgi:hypothetical protein